MTKRLKQEKDPWSVIQDAQGRTRAEFMLQRRQKAQGIVRTIKEISADMADQIVPWILDFWQSLPPETQAHLGVFYAPILYPADGKPIVDDPIATPKRKAIVISYLKSWERIIRSIVRAEIRSVSLPDDKVFVAQAVKDGTGLTTHVTKFIVEQRQLMQAISSSQKHGVCVPSGMKPHYPPAAKRLGCKVSDLLQTVGVRTHAKATCALLGALGIPVPKHSPKSSAQRRLLHGWR